MAKQSIGLGTTANDGTGDDLRTAGDKINDNTNEIYSAIGDGTTINLPTAVAGSTRDWRGAGSEALSTAITALEAAASSGISDGDKGDITVSGTGATWTVDAGAITTAKIGDAQVTLAKMANLAQDQFIGRTTASTGVPQTATITAAARTVLDDTTVAAMVNTLGGEASTGSGGIARATSPTFVTPALGTPASGTLTNCTALPISGVTSLQAALDAKLDLAIASDITATVTTPDDGDELIMLDVSDTDTPKLTTVGGIRTRLANQVVGSALGTTGTVDLDLATLTGTVQTITATGAITFTTSNRAAGRHLELRIAAGGASRTITWPAWVAFGAALPTTIASDAVLRVTLECLGAADTNIDATSVVSV